MPRPLRLARFRGRVDAALAELALPDDQHQQITNQIAATVPRPSLLSLVAQTQREFDTFLGMSVRLLRSAHDLSTGCR